MDHLGVEVESTDQVDAASQRLTGEGMETLVENGTTCCYALQDNVWVHGPEAARSRPALAKQPDVPTDRAQRPGVRALTLGCEAALAVRAAVRADPCGRPQLPARRAGRRAGPGVEQRVGVFLPAPVFVHVDPPSRVTRTFAVLDHPSRR
jgi:hypothetical protein